MSDTKEKILSAALKLFARDGYEAVSVSEIAGEIGITKGALYKHYKNKRDIFDSIVERMYSTDAERSREFEVPENKYGSDPRAYKRVSADDVKSFTLAQFDYWTKDPFASDFLKMLTIESYRDAEAAKLYDSCICGGPVLYMKDIFSEMMQNGILKKSDPYILALEFYSPLYLLIKLYDNSDDKENLSVILSNHVDLFFENNLVIEN